MTRTAILSDIHGNLNALRAVMDHVESQNVDRLVCLGDVVGYGPRPCECLDVVMGFAFCVLGNHDSSALFDPEGFNAAAEQAIFWTRNQLENTDKEPDEDGISGSRKRMQFLCKLPRTVREENTLFVHGSPRGPTNEYVMPEDVQNSKKMEKLFSLVPHLCFQGHTHVPGVFNTDHQFVRPAEISPNEGYDISNPDLRLMINVGSVGQPRDGDSRSCYVVLDEQRIFYHRVEYDIEATVSEIEAATELDNFLGYRLRDGR